MDIHKIESWRKERKITYAELSRLLEISTVSIHKVFRRGGRLDAYHFEKLVEISGGAITWEDFAPSKRKAVNE